MLEPEGSRSIRFPQSFYASARRSTGPRKTRTAPTPVKAGALSRVLVRSRVRVGLSYFFSPVVASPSISAERQQSVCDRRRIFSLRDGIRFGPIAPVPG